MAGQGRADMTEDAGQDAAKAPTFLAGFFESTLGLAAGLILFALMTVTVIDVAGRYLFSAPLPSGYELIKIGMALIVFAAVPVCTARDEQIRVEVFQLLFPRRTRGFLGVVSLIISLVVIAGFAWLLLQRAQSFVLSEETTSNLQVPLAPLAFFIAASWAVCAVIVVVQLLTWRRKRSRDKPTQ